MAEPKSRAPIFVGLGCGGFIGLIVIIFAIAGAMAPSGDGSYNGCPKGMDNFHDCIYREGEWSGIPDVPDQ